MKCYKCNDKARQMSTYTIRGHRRHVCMMHYIENRQTKMYAVNVPRQAVDIERSEQDYKRNSGTELERIIYNRELSFSEKLDLVLL